MAWTDLPDGYKITMMVGQDETGSPVVVKVGGAGEIIAVMKGETALGALKSLRTDSDGQIITILKGASGVNVGVNADGFLTTIIKGVHAADLVTVAVDADGNILGVLKGDYAGSLKTLAVDELGRMQAVLSDPEDVFGNPHYMGAAELAARMGAATVYDRRGQVIFIDDMSKGTSPYVLFPSVTYVYSDGEYSDMSGFSIHLVTGADAGDAAYIQRRMHAPAKYQLGVEASFMPNDTDCIIQLELQADDPDGNLYSAKCRYNWNTGKLYIQVGLAWVEVADFDLIQGTNNWHIMKMVVDLETGYYVRLLVDEAEYDISASVIDYSAGTFTRRMNVTARGENATAGSKDIYVGRLIVTCAEPV